MIAILTRISWINEMTLIYKPPEPRLLFGQFLLEEKKVTEEVLARALVKQKDQGESNTVKESYRFLGQILLEDFGIFKNRVELNRILIKFKEYKSKIENEHAELKSIME